MKLVAQLISVTFFSIYLMYILKKKQKERERKRDTNSQQERKYDGHLGGGPSFYLKIIPLMRVQDIGTFEVAIVSCYDNMS